MVFLVTFSSLVHSQISVEVRSDSSRSNVDAGWRTLVITVLSSTEGGNGKRNFSSNCYSKVLKYN